VKKKNFVKRDYVVCVEFECGVKFYESYIKRCHFLLFEKKITCSHALCSVCQQQFQSWINNPVVRGRPLFVAIHGWTLKDSKKMAISLNSIVSFSSTVTASCSHTSPFTFPFSFPVFLLFSFQILAFRFQLYVGCLCTLSGLLGIFECYLWQRCQHMHQVRGLELVKFYYSCQSYGYKGTILIRLSFVQIHKSKSRGSGKIRNLSV